MYCFCEPKWLAAFLDPNQKIADAVAYEFKGDLDAAGKPKQHCQKWASQYLTLQFISAAAIPIALTVLNAISNTILY